MHADPDSQVKVKLPLPFDTQHTWEGVVHVDVPHESVPPACPPLLDPLLPLLDPAASVPELPPASAGVPLLEPVPPDPLLDVVPLLDVLPPLDVLPELAPEELPPLLDPVPPELPEPLPFEASPASPPLP